MRWSPWPPLISRKYSVKLTVQRLEFQGEEHDHDARLSVEITWKGPKRRAVRRNFTREEAIVKTTRAVEWDEDFYTLCSLSGYKLTTDIFHPWELNLTVFHRSDRDLKHVFGSATLNLAEYASKTEDQPAQLKAPLTLSPSAAIQCQPPPFLWISLELKDTQQQRESIQLPSSEKDQQLSAIKAGLRKVKLFKEYVSARRVKRDCHETGSPQFRYSFSVADGGEYVLSWDSDSDEYVESAAIRKSLSYGSLHHADYSAGLLSYSSVGISNLDESFIYYSDRPRSESVTFFVEEPVITIPEKSLILKYRRIVPWRMRRKTLRSPIPKGEPLLKSAYGEEGGDDIDFDRRQLSSNRSLLQHPRTVNEDWMNSHHSPPVSAFGDDSFAVGTWEHKEITSRDGQLKIETRVFFASIDQRSEQAAGEGACTALVAVIADWLQNNQDLMPIKSQFDSLIRDGSWEWRNLCENETFQEKYPDKHFDLDTVLEARTGNLSVVPEKSFIGFFHPNCTEGGNFDFLDGAMSFDSIWDEISCIGCGPQVFIISWNDHFFVLKVENDAYYIIDTLGERLHEGCNQAYILKFDENTAIYKLQSSNESVEAKLQNTSEDSEEENPVTRSEEPETKEYGDVVIITRGKKACKEYMKSFLAALPIRELQEDIKKGLPLSSPLHHRLQIEFHFTELQKPQLDSPEVEVSSSEEYVDATELPQIFTHKSLTSIHV